MVDTLEPIGLLPDYYISLAEKIFQNAQERTASPSPGPLPTDALNTGNALRQTPVQLGARNPRNSLSGYTLTKATLK